MNHLGKTRSERNGPGSGNHSSKVICVGYGEGSAALLLVADDGKRWIMPWLNFQCAHYEDVADLERIMLFYSSHQITVEGIRLEILVEDHLRKLGVEWLRSYDDCNEELCPDDQPFIRRIIVEESGKKKEHT